MRHSGSPLANLPPIKAKMLKKKKKNYNFILFIYFFFKEKAETNVINQDNTQSVSSWKITQD